MLRVLGHRSSACDGLTRRDVLRAGTLAALGAFGISALIMVLGAVLVWLFVREPAPTQTPAL